MCTLKNKPTVSPSVAVAVESVVFDNAAAALRLFEIVAKKSFGKMTVPLSVLVGMRCFGTSLTTRHLNVTEMFSSNDVAVFRILPTAFVMLSYEP